MPKRKVNHKEVDQALCASHCLDYVRVTTPGRDTFWYYISYFFEADKDVAREVRM